VLGEGKKWKEVKAWNFHLPLLPLDEGEKLGKIATQAGHIPPPNG